MVEEVGSKVVAEPTGGLPGLNAGSSTPPKTPAQARKHFSQPATYPDFTPPPYRSISGLKRIGLDIEGLDPKLGELGPGAYRYDEGGKVVGVAIAYEETDASYYPTAHEVGPNVEDPDKFYARLAQEAKTFEGEIVGANLQYDLDWLGERHGIRFPNARFRDVQIAEPLLDENRMTYKLAALADDYLDDAKKNEHLVARYGSGYIENMHKVHSGDASVYGIEDTLLPWRIMDLQLKKLDEEQLLELFYMESALTPLLLEMRSRGVRVNVGRAQEALEQLKEEEASIKKRIDEIGGRRVDIWSADSLAGAWKNLGLDHPKTKTGRPSFTKGYLSGCNHEIAQLVTQARENSKVGGTFIDSYILKGHVDGRIHCMFNQLKSDESGTVSGRFSSSGPNLQNIPSRHPVLGPLMRSMFIPEEDHDWGSLDWSQIEYRLLVHYAAITSGIDASEAVKAYRSDPKTDFHELASNITGVPRKSAKGINFGVVYGMGVPKLAADLGITIKEAQAMLAQFQEAAPFMRGMLDRCSNAASHRGYIKTILGRKRRFDVWECRYWDNVAEEEAIAYVSDRDLGKWKETNADKARGKPRRAATHKALNALLQGSAADLMKIAMVRMWDDGIFSVLVPHLTVHDEFNSSVPRTPEGKEAFEEMREIMQTAIPLEVPVLADGKLGANWDEAK